MVWIFGSAALVALLFAMHHLGLLLERRGWLNYTRASRKSRASLVVAAEFDPAARRILELREEEREEEGGEEGEGYDPPDDSHSPVSRTKS